MTSEDRSKLDEVLEAILDLAPADRPAYLERVCREDTALKSEAEGLLAAAAAARVFDRPAAALVRSFRLSAAGDECPGFDGATVGPYRVLRELARGGMGTVFLAERADGQFEQRVALKLIQRGLDSDEIQRRFLAERRILARLQHPNIARLLDGGVTPEGQPWFAMEYVDGLPLTVYCDQHGLSIARRLRLFEGVCRAVRYAHQNLVVHRDLKPSNILVTVQDDVKLLDFGIARLLQQDSADQTVLTEIGQHVMTPAYAAPEQVRGESVTTATDVYALGAVLYELLTGHRAQRFERHTAAEVERVICEVEPDLPSAAVTRTFDQSDADRHQDLLTPEMVSQARSTEPGRLRRELSGDLDRIVLKALKKEPARRYPSADALLADLERYEAGLPVQARPDSRLYRAGKFVRRHRAGVAAGVAMAGLFVAGLLATAWQARVAVGEAAEAREVKNFVKDLFDVSTPAESRGREVTARELLERGTKRVDSTLAGQPEVQLELLHFLGEVHRDLGYYDRADSLLRRAQQLARRMHGPATLGEAQELATRGTVYLEQGEYDRAESVLVVALALRRARGADDSVLSVNLNDLAVVLSKKGHRDSAEALYRQTVAIDITRYGPQHLVLAEALNNLGLILSENGRLPAADSAIRAALAIRRKRLHPDHPELLATAHNLAFVLQQQGNLPEAERLQRDVVERKRRIYPEGHPDLAVSLQQLGNILEYRGRYAEAESVAVEGLEIRRKWLGTDHPETVGLVANLGLLNYRMGDLPAAETAMREALASYRRALGPEHPTTLTLLQNVGAVLSDQGRYAEAEPLLLEGLALRRKVRGDSSADVAGTLRNVGVLRHRQGRLQEAEHSLREALAIDRAALPPRHPITAGILSSLGAVLTDRGRGVEAEPLLREALAVRRESHGPDDPRALETQSALGGCLGSLGRWAEAEPLLLESYRKLRASSYGAKELPAARERLAVYYERRGDRAEAKMLRQDTLVSADRH